jgi:hypothetical protein
MNILKDKLAPKTFGEFIDSLIITNIRMWHAQEIVYEVETLEKLSKEEMFDFLKDATWLNLMRNKMMEGVELSFSSILSEKTNYIPNIINPELLNEIILDK